MVKIHKSLIGATLLSCLLTASPILAEDTQPKGKDGQLEWEITQNWQGPTGVIDFVHSLDGKLVFFLTDDQKVKVYTASGVYQGAAPAPTGVTNIDISPRGESLYLVNSANNEFSAMSIDFVAHVDPSGSPQKGNPDAPVKIVVFTDFECPYCSKLVPMLEQIYESNEKNVLITFKNMPLNFHKFAKKAALTGLAAAEQGKFWEYHDKIFAIDKLNDDAILETAEDLDLDMGQLKKDIASPAIKNQLEADIAQANKAGVTGTPTVFINGRKLKKRDIQSFQIMIDAELKKAGKL